MSGEFLRKPAKLAKMRPTRMTTGLIEVETKRRDWRGVSEDERIAYLIHNAFPAVRGPEDRIFIVDHHHLGRALIEEGVSEGYVAILNDFSRLEQDDFWIVMDHHQWAHAYDAEGRRHPFSEIPKKLTKLVDDQYRSLAAEVRRRGGFAKETVPYAEFLWADFFRRRINGKSLDGDFQAAVDQAIGMSHDPEAEHLPGWSGTTT